jgi:predicted SAM-dependent methyltransferase
MIRQKLKQVLPEYVLKGWREARKNQIESRLLKTGAKNARKIINEKKSIFLEIGSGSKKGTDGWTTLDVCTDCDIYWDLLLPLPFPDNSVTKIYSSHVLEHFFYPDLMRLLAECYRILEPDGVFSVCVPNANMYIKGYLSVEEFKPKDIFEPAYFSNTKIDNVNYIAYMDGHHRYMFDQQNLLAVLEKADFKEVRHRNFEPVLDRQERDWESIYAEGKKYYL